MAVIDQGAPVELSIETGPHAGVKRRLAFGVATFGRGLDSDIVLADEAMVESHAEATLSATGVAIKALDGDLIITDDNNLLRAGHDAQLPWPAHVTLGRTRIAFSLAHETAGSKPASRLTMWPALSGGAVLVAAVLLGSQYLPALEQAEPERETLPFPEALNLTAPGADLASMLPDKETISDAMDGLEYQIETVGLAGLEVLEDDGSIVVSGLLNSDDEPLWHDVEMWFDQTFGSSFPLDSRLSIDDRQVTPDITIRAVWSGPSSYLVAGDGQRYAVGSMMPGGWRVDAIETDAVVFQRDRQTFRFDFQS